MVIRKRPNGSWQLDVHVDGRRFRQTLAGSLTPAEVKAEHHRFSLARAAERPDPRRGPALIDLLTRYWDEHGRHLASASSEQGYLKIWRDALGRDRPLATIGSDAIAAIVAGWRTEVSQRKHRPVRPATINRRIGCLQRVWRRAADLWKWRLDSVPWGRLKLDEPEPEDRALTRAEAFVFQAALPPRSRHAFAFALATGLRRGPILRLTMAQFDWPAGVIDTKSKGRAGGKRTTVPITAGVLEVLCAIGCLPRVGRLFPLAADTLRRDLDRARSLTGLRHVRFHDTRHTFAQRLDDAGLGDVITDALHHADPRLRRRYSTAKIDRVRAAIELADRNSLTYRPKYS